jgi:hypothetical protein
MSPLLRGELPVRLRDALGLDHLVGVHVPVAMDSRNAAKAAPKATKKAPSVNTRETSPKLPARKPAKRSGRVTPSPRSSAKRGRSGSLTEPRSHVSRGIRDAAHAFTCQMCGASFKSSRADALFCSNACRQMNYRRSR